MKPVVELLRVSTSEQGGEDRAGIPRQIEANRRTVEKHGLTIIQSIRLIDVSGASIIHAPEVSGMLDMLRSGHACGIVCADFDRLLRPDDFRSLAILQDIKEADARIYLPDQVIDLNTQSGYLISGLNSIIAGNELAQIKKRMLGAKEEKRRQGKHPGNQLTLPLGVVYDRQAERYCYTDKASKVRRLFSLFHAGNRNYSELARELGLNSNVTVRNLLMNELYIGYRCYKEKRSTDKRIRPDGRRADKKKISRAEHEIIRVKVIDTPLIPESVFWEVQDFVNNRQNDYTDRRGAAKQLFMYAGLLRCGICGSPMYTVPGGKNPNKDYYYCRNKSHHWRVKNSAPPCSSSYLRREPTEEMLTNFIAENLSNPDFVLAGIVTLFGERDNAHHERQKTDLEKRLTGLRKKKARLADMVIDGVFTLDDVAGKAKTIEDEIRQVTQRLDDMSVPEVPQNPDDYRETVEALSSAFFEFPFWSAREKREFLKIQRPEFYITPDGVTKFTLPVCKSGNRMGAASVLADEQHEIRLAFDVVPPFPFFPAPTACELGLPTKDYYTTTETAKAIGEHRDSFRKRLLSGEYPDAALKLGNGARRFTVEEVTVLAVFSLNKRIGLHNTIDIKRLDMT